MKDVFDARNNLGEWIQNDWESDDFIESSKVTRSKRTQKIQEQESNISHWIIAIIIALLASPLFWIGVLILGFWIEG